MLMRVVVDERLPYEEGWARPEEQITADEILALAAEVWTS